MALETLYLPASLWMPALIVLAAVALIGWRRGRGG